MSANTSENVLPDDVWLPSVDVCAHCADVYCDGVACIADLDPDNVDDQEALNELHDIIRLGQAWRIAQEHGADVARAALRRAGYRLDAATTTERLTLGQRANVWRRANNYSTEPFKVATKLTEEIGEVARALVGIDERRAGRGDLVQEAAQSVIVLAALLDIVFPGNDLLAAVEAEMDRSGAPPATSTSTAGGAS